jgi:predicted ester cyclase
LEAVFVATHVAEFAGVPASNAQVRMPYSVFYDISADKITALRAYFPVSALIAQLQEAASVSA